ncbi:GNAT family N-acetyltransferase [Nocardioides sp. TF02-7]|uniref:GNAT family N-acetyltransferase n=1 Tax=Nocardioides sp. TF02-7 TaxID=2917724 RepID=UPI001F056AA2|nr:GNAT family N-acetyltransferase [Nocardioides sp. TF02-7]UMG92143.1 GNAT family N-acetyltransferase [Nocardioides sp. TF02-7]
MSRVSLTPRAAVREDAPVLAELWSDVLRRVDRAEQVADLELVIKAAAASPEQRLVVVEYGGAVAGAVFLRLTTLSPINLESCVQSIQPRVLPEYRRHGVGRALMDAAASFAEENGVLHLNATVPSTARDANRFMARLGLAPAATYRLAPVSLVRSRLSPPRPHVGTRSVPRVLAVRRTQRRARAGQEELPLPE